MKSFIFAAAVFVVLAAPAFCQVPVASPTPMDGQVVRINTDLIQIDVTVLDKDGKIVTDLKPEDFELYENRQLQKIANFSFVSRLVGGATVNADSPTSTIQTSDRPIQSKRDDVRRTIALVVDDLNLSFASVYYTRKALLRFVDEQMQPGDLVAVIRTGGAVGALQQFTSDKAILRAAIEKIRWNPFSNIEALTSVGQTNSEISDRFSRESDQLLYGKQNTVIHPHDNIDQIQKQTLNASRNAAMSARAAYTQSSLGTLRFIIQGMKELPGRKAMMLFSDGISIGDESNNKSQAPAVYDFLQSVTDAANRASVTIYTFDSRGMQSMSIAASDNTYEIIDGHREVKVKQRDRDFRDAQDGLAYLAGQTGGSALLNSNDINGGIDRALNEQSGYYLLAYVPDSDTFEPGKRKFNKIEIKVKRPGVKVSYRSGFFNTETPEQTPKLSVEKSLANALISPFAQSEIALTVNALFASEPAQGTYLRSFLHIDARSLKFEDVEDGWKKATFDVAAVTFGSNGAVGDLAQANYSIKAKGPTLDAVMTNGFVYVLILPVKQAGTYQYRVALRDASTGKIGTASQLIEIPDLKRQLLTLSTVAVENVSMNTWQLISQGKWAAPGGGAQLKSTLLYDTVLRRFRPGTVLRYGFEVYNSRADSSKSVHLESQVDILQNGSAVVLGNVSKYDSADLSNLPRISGAVMLNEKLQPGEYALQLTVKDTVSKQETRQLFTFDIE